ncbi:hypothetical protein [Thiocystis violacea]|uniref:hypothetical protein n=1 Tax=Thiocystis violacea TaxID=13725 RepID=UPI0019049DD8|nr:hypothetical protein [Thiocystis violacea]MBK1721030.1 hypothetical protein [Thiocystis violacea]
MMNGRDADSLAVLCAECQRLRQQLREAHRALAFTSGGADATLPVNLDQRAHAPRRDTEAAVTDLHQRVDRGVPRAEIQEIDAIGQSLEQARSKARDLLESAIAAHARAEAINDALQREIDNRKRIEAALRDAEERYNRMLQAIGDTQWLSAADGRTLLRIESPRRGAGEQKVPPLGGEDVSG